MVDYPNLVFNLLAVIAGSAATFFAVWWAEKRKEKKDDELKIYAPLYYELEEVYQQVATLSDWRLMQEWTRIGCEHIEYRIQPRNLQQKISQLYGSEFRNFFVNGRLTAVREVSKYLSEELKAKYNPETISGEYLGLSIYLMAKGNEYSLYEATNAFNQFKNAHHIKYNTLEELDKDLRPKVQEMEMVKELLKDQKRLMTKIAEIRAELGKKLKIKDPKPKYI